MKIVDDLIELGLTEGEAKVYVALTEVGSSTVGPIVNKSGVAYSNVYEVLNRLIEKGLVSFIIKEKTKYFQAGGSENLKEYLNKREEELESMKEKLDKMLPNLENLKNLPPQQEAEVFVGFKGLRTAYDKMFGGMKRGEEHLFLYVHTKEYGEEADNFYFSIGHLMKGKKIRGLNNEYGRKSEFVKKAKYIDSRYASFPIPGNWEVNRDMLLIVSWQKPVVGILIRSKSVTDEFRKYFESVWNKAKK